MEALENNPFIISPSSSKMRFYRCKICNFETFNVRDFLYHRRDVHGEHLSIHECQLCSFASDNTYKLRRHYECSHEDSKPSSSLPKKSSFSIESLMSSSPSYNLPMSHYQFNGSNMSLMEQAPNKHYYEKDKEMYRCQQCKFFTHHLPAYESHLRHHTATFKCHYCSFATSKRSHLEGHVLKHFEETGEFCCIKCNFKTETKQSLTVHIKNHHDRETPLSASPTMEFSLPTKFEPTIMSQKKQTSNLEGKTQTCTICGYKAKWQSEVMRHMRVHSVEQPYKCKYCPYSAKWRGSLYKHLVVTHNDYSLVKRSPRSTTKNEFENPFESSKYFKPYEPSQQLYEPTISQQLLTAPSHHSMLQNGNYFQGNNMFQTNFMSDSSYEESLVSNIFRCSFCSFISNSHSEVKSHISEQQLLGQGHASACAIYVDTDQEMMSSNDPSISPRESGTIYSCFHCGYNNTQKRSVISHLGVHGKVVPYFCKICNLSSNWQHIIAKHIKTDHNGNVYESLMIRIAYESKNNKIALTKVYPDGIAIKISGTPSLLFYQCDICPYKTNKTIFLKRHSQLHRPREDAPFKCSICPYYVNLDKTLEAHMRWHQSTSKELLPIKTEIPPKQIINLDSNNQLHICRECPYWTNKLSSLLFHKQFHRPTKNAAFRCMDCTFWSQDEKQLLNHRKFHSNNSSNNNNSNSGNNDIYGAKEQVKFKNKLSNDLEISLVTDSSEEIEMKPSLFENHLRSEYNYIEKSESFYSNEHIPQTSSIFSLLVQEETETKQFASSKSSSIKELLLGCSKCPAYFHTSEIFNFHSSLHEGKGYFKCHRCSYCTFSKSNLSAHRLLHDKSGHNSISHDDKASIVTCDCPKCPAKFAKKKALLKHLSFHGSPNQYTCDLCDYSVANKVNLFNHSVVHEMPNSNPKTKAKSIKGAVPFKTCEKTLWECHLCPYLSNNKEDIESHIPKHQEGDSPLCFYCTYHSSENMQEHEKCHFSWPRTHLQPTAYIKNASFEIWSIDGGKKDLMFKNVVDLVTEEESQISSSPTPLECEP